MGKQKIAVIALVVLLIGAFCYIGIGKWNNVKQEKESELFQQAALYGYEQAVVQLAQEVVKCEQVPLRIGNQSINVVAVDCLQQ